MMNSVNIIGFIHEIYPLPPESSGMCRFNIVFYDGFGEDREKFLIDVFSDGGTAKFIRKHFRVGDRIAINGKLAVAGCNLPVRDEFGRLEVFGRVNTNEMHVQIYASEVEFCEPEAVRLNRAEEYEQRTAEKAEFEKKQKSGDIYRESLRQAEKVNKTIGALPSDFIDMAVEDDDDLCF